MRWHTANRHRAKREAWRRRHDEDLKAKILKILDAAMEKIAKELIERVLWGSGGMLFRAAMHSGGVVSPEFMLPRSHDLNGRVVGFGEDGVTHIAIDGDGQASIGLLAPPADEVPPGSYRCESCGGIFENGWSDEEAEAEAADNFPGLKAEDAATVCEDCFADLMGKARAEGLVQ